MKLILFISFLASAGCAVAQPDLRKLAGKWRGVCLIRNNIEVPFNFEIDKMGTVYLLNADERFETGKVTIQKDSVFIPLDQFDNELAFAFRKKIMNGELRKQDHTGTPLPVTAEKNVQFRFKENNALPATNMSGTYNIEFTFESGKRERSVAVFQQKGKYLTGTFLKESGDARYLQGIAEGDTFFLSSFIGSSPGYYTGSVKQGIISGAQLGSRITHRFTGKLDENAALPNAYEQHATDDRPPLQVFSFSDIDGNIITPADEKYRNKVLIIPITGTWCPNCIDEAAFLSPWYLKNKDRGVEIITIHYERQTDTAFYRKVMRRFRQRFDIGYDQVFGGISSTDTVKSSLQLPAFRAFPTTLFIDKKGRISKIHSGYSGPATGKFYDEFIKEFNDEVNKLLNE